MLWNTAYFRNPPSFTNWSWGWDCSRQRSASWWLAIECLHFAAREAWRHPEWRRTWKSCGKRSVQDAPSPYRWCDLGQSIAGGRAEGKHMVLQALKLAPSLPPILDAGRVL